MTFKNKRSISDWSARRSERFGQLGRMQELQVEELLQKMKDDGSLTDFVRHPPHGPEDGDGKDFTVTVGEETRHFGISISAASQRRSSQKHPDVPQFTFPLATTHATMRKRILGLFKPAKAQEG